MNVHTIYVNGFWNLLNKRWVFSAKLPAWLYHLHPCREFSDIQMLTSAGNWLRDQYLKVPRKAIVLGLSSSKVLPLAAPKTVFRNPD